MRTRKFQRPEAIEAFVAQAFYERWLQRKAIAHVKRDRRRGNLSISVSMYKTAIHDAVRRSQGRDHYTDEVLDWTLISTYDNERSRLERRSYKAGLALLPTVDHLNDGLGPADFVICGWRTNDAKNDMTVDEFVGLCRKVVAVVDRGEAGQLS